MKRFWDETMFTSWGKVDGKVACAFSSSGGWGGGAEIACQSLQMVLMNFGFLVFGVTDYAGKTMTARFGSGAEDQKPPRMNTENTDQNQKKSAGDRINRTHRIEETDGTLPVFDPVDPVRNGLRTATSG